MTTNNIRNDGTLILNQPSAQPSQPAVQSNADASPDKEKKSGAAIAGAAGAALGSGTAYALTQSDEATVGNIDANKPQADAPTEPTVESNTETPPPGAGPNPVIEAPGLEGPGPEPANSFSPSQEPITDVGNINVADSGAGPDPINVDPRPGADPAALAEEPGPTGGLEPVTELPTGQNDPNSEPVLPGAGAINETPPPVIDDVEPIENQLEDAVDPTPVMAENGPEPAGNDVDDSGSHGPSPILGGIIGGAITGILGEVVERIIERNKDDSPNEPAQTDTPTAEIPSVTTSAENPVSDSQQPATPPVSGEVITEQPTTTIEEPVETNDIPVPATDEVEPPLPGEVTAGGPTTTVNEVTAGTSTGEIVTGEIVTDSPGVDSLGVDSPADDDVIEGELVEEPVMDALPAEDDSAYDDYPVDESGSGDDYSDDNQADTDDAADHSFQ